ncbi:temperature sensitive supressor [Sorangium cellulosum]|uniref:Temperature sensitive supressor n=1 Tax=Sorangium cellulosum TaxID=56 RepID=A0A2L0F2Q2_SORCE|nr:alpha/beta fold hydrolase [Sorangium cellulosum]AUX45781.1 temperature sensitive supressor [Sorangium cellulosum]
MPTNTPDDQLDPLFRALDASSRSAGVFFPRRDRTTPPAGATDHEIPVEPGVALGARWHLADPRQPTVLAFHGNGETVSDYDDIAEAWREIGLNLFMVDYRGYGWSSGRPTLRSLYEDPAKVSAFFLRELAEKSRAAGLDRPPKPLLFGRSLGSSPASRIAAQRGDDYHALVLESGFGDVRQLLALFDIPLGDLQDEAHRHFSNPELLKHVQIPVLVLHGALDRLLPPDHARANHAAVPHDRKALRLIDGAGHNDILGFAQAYFGAIRAFLQKH